METSSRLKLTAAFVFVRRSVAQVSSRLFAPPGARGTIHARWFALGLLLVFMVIVTFAEPDELSVAACAVAVLVMWTIRWCFPRWDPAALARVSLLASAHLVFYLSAVSSQANPFVSTLLPFSMLMVAGLWALQAAWTDHRLRSGRHPRWVMAEHKGEGIVLRERASDEGYRSSTKGPIVGSLPGRRGPGRNVIASLCVFAQFHLLEGLCFLTPH